MRHGGSERKKKRGGCQGSRDTGGPKHGRAAVIGLDHPSGLAECLGWLDCCLPAGLGACMNEGVETDRSPV